MVELRRSGANKIREKKNNIAAFHKKNIPRTVVTLERVCVI